MPELEKKCYQLFGDENCDQQLTHASQEDDGKGVALCGSCAARHHTESGQTVRGMGTTDWVKPPTCGHRPQRTRSRHLRLHPT